MFISSPRYEEVEVANSLFFPAVAGGSTLKCLMPCSYSMSAIFPKMISPKSVSQSASDKARVSAKTVRYRDAVARGSNFSYTHTYARNHKNLLALELFVRSGDSQS